MSSPSRPKPVGESMLTSAERPVWASARQWVVALIAAPACAVFSLLLLSIRHVEHVPGAFVVALAALAALSAWRPGAALMALAAAVPVANWTGRWWNWTVAWPEALVVAFAAGYSARALWTRRSRGDDLQLPIFVFTALVVASLAVRILVLDWTIGGQALWEQLTQLAAGDYFVGSGGFRELDAAMRLIEGMVLLRAASRIARDAPSFAPRLMHWFVAGAAAAAALNLWRVWEGALRGEAPADTFIRYLTNLRYNVHYSDVNAAGSYFVMALLLAVGVGAAARRASWAGAALLMATSLAMSGSRAALLAGSVSALAWTAWRFRHRFHQPGSRAVMSTVSALLLIACAAAALYYVAARRNLTPSSTALQVRAEFARTTFRMIEDSPAFGVGIGQYADRSTEFSSPTLVQTLAMPRENAHNNFLQVLGELGLLGFAGFLWVLWSAGRQCLDGLQRRSDLASQGAVFGAVAFVLTWFSGHPLLIDEPALLFWLLLGTAAAGSPDGAAGAATVRGRATAIVLIPVLLACSVPLRANHLVANANLEHRGIGLSGWHHGPDGVRYRLAGSHSTLFVPADASVVTFLLGGARPGVELEVALVLDGHRADVVEVRGEGWRRVQFALRPDRESPRFHRLELRVLGEWPIDRPLLRVGKVEPR